MLLVLMTVMFMIIIMFGMIIKYYEGQNTAYHNVGKEALTGWKETLDLVHKCMTLLDQCEQQRQTVNETVWYPQSP